VSRSVGAVRMSPSSFQTYSAPGIQHVSWHAVPFIGPPNSDAPRSGYYARVRVSARSADDARVPVRQRDYSREHAIRVTSKP
jgi:hypothetical protein